VKSTPIAALLPIVVLFAGAGLLWIIDQRASKPKVEARPARCESCGAEYVRRTGGLDEPCPECGSGRVTSIQRPENR